MFEFLESISNFFTSGIYDWFTATAAYFAETLTIWYIKSQIWGLTFAWEVGQNVLSGLNINAQISAAFGGLPPPVAQAAQFFRVPEAINLLLSAGVTRLVMSLIPGV